MSNKCKGCRYASWEVVAVPCESCKGTPPVDPRRALQVGDTVRLIAGWADVQKPVDNKNIASAYWCEELSMDEVYTIASINSGHGSIRVECKTTFFNPACFEYCEVVAEPVPEPIAELEYEDYEQRLVAMLLPYGATLKNIVNASFAHHRLKTLCDNVVQDECNFTGPVSEIVAVLELTTTIKGYIDQYKMAAAWDDAFGVPAEEPKLKSDSEPADKLGCCSGSARRNCYHGGMP